MRGMQYRLAPRPRHRRWSKIRSAGLLVGLPAIALAVGCQLLAWAGGIFVLSFIPFGLPAPSYNTLGQQALTIALALFGYAALLDGRTRQQAWCLIASACAWAVATVVYPPLIMPLGAMWLGLSLYSRRRRRRAAEAFVAQAMRSRILTADSRGRFWRKLLLRNRRYAW